ncbi:uncharacterized protein FRV6_14211 [Fusarium oxysporum]|uniref:Uncharacterized protein n=1 Tax=Fusarium oxysporum TaxID=5507 RepID=A0A2H3TN74_FUSOX|nr:uncharacterized protein FRV6_14211 [Fusarium oxysporum]
MINLLKTF